MSERVVGVDPSLSSTGFAVITRTSGAGALGSRIFLTTATLKSELAKVKTPFEEVERVADLVDQVCTSAAGARAVYIESLAYASRTGKYAERAHLYFSLLAALSVRRVTIELVTPAHLKKTITGNGRADKEEVIRSVRDAWSEWGWVDGLSAGRSDRADASALAWIAASDLRWSVPPLHRKRVTSAA